jgi:toxin ParE1/3/4
LKRDVRKSVLAENDLIAIWIYTFEEWGATQADKYLDELAFGIEQLAENPEVGEKRDGVREGYRVVLINRHAVYYTVTPRVIHVVRVLHGRMDTSRHL